MFETSGGEPSGGIAGWATDLMDALGAPGAGLAVALENLFPPIPSEVVLPLAGFTAGQGEMNLLAAIVWTTLGSVVGAVVLYAIGQLLGRERMRGLAERLPLVKVQDVDRAEEWFARYGRSAVLFGRMIPLVRSFISIPAGIERMPMPTFIVYTLIGSLGWNTALVMAGYGLGDNWNEVERYVGPVSKGVAALIVVAVLVFIAVRLIGRRRSAARPGVELDGDGPAGTGSAGADPSGARSERVPEGQLDPERS
jgi:membrane protein DedA with SNARE-associated domain